MDGVQQNLPSEWLGEKLHGAGLHRFHRHRNVPVAGDEDNRYGHIAGGQVALKVEATDSRQADIQHQAGGRIGAVTCEKLRGRTERHGGQAYGMQEALDCSAGGGIVVHDIYDGFLSSH
jgi:hypothetical protein